MFSSRYVLIAFLFALVAFCLASCRSTGSPREILRQAPDQRVVVVMPPGNLSGRPLVNLDNDLWRRGDASDQLLNMGTQSFLATFQAALGAVLTEAGYGVRYQRAGEAKAEADAASASYRLHAAIARWDASQLTTRGTIGVGATVVLTERAGAKVLARGDAQAHLQAWELNAAQEMLVEAGYGAAPTHRQRNLEKRYQWLAYDLAQDVLDQAEVLPLWRDE